MTVRRAWWARWARWAHGLGGEVSGFAAVGACAYAADVGLFVWLGGPLGVDPLTAKAVSFLLGCTVAYTGNALGPYRRRGRGSRAGRWRQYGVFFLVNVAGAAVQLGCLGLSHYALGLTSQRADIVSGVGVGAVLGTAVRFWGTRTLVFGAGARSRPEGPGDTPPAPARTPTETGP